MTRVKEFVAAFGVAVKNLGADNGSVAAAGVGFFSFLALVPAMVAAISIYGLWLNPADLENQIADLTESMPSDAASLVTRQLEGIATTKGLGPIAIVTVALALWSASGALKNLMTTLNTAYGRVERRKFFKLRGTALLLTIGAILAMVAATALIATLPSLLDTLDLSTSVRTVVRLARWVLLGFGMLVGLSVIYRFGPDRTGEDFEYITAGAVTAMLTWILVAFGFSYYADHYGTYGETFGAMAGLVMLLMWLYLTNLAVIFGAEVNAALAGRPAVDRRALVESGEDSDGHAVVGTEDGSIQRGRIRKGDTGHQDASDHEENTEHASNDRASHEEEAQQHSDSDEGTVPITHTVGDNQTPPTDATEASADQPDPPSPTDLPMTHG